MRRLILAIIMLQTTLAFATHNPKIEIDTESWDFGEIAGDEVLKHKFKVKNTGDDTLEIKHLTTSCGCVTANMPFRKLFPNESTELTAKLYPQQIKTRGKIKYDIFIETNDPENRIKIIFLFAEL